MKTVLIGGVAGGATSAARLRKLAEAVKIDQVAQKLGSIAFEMVI